MGGASHRGRGQRGVGALVLAATLLVCGCVGAVPRDEFDEMVAERGGGLVSALPLEAIAVVESHLGATDLAFEQIVVNPSSRVVSLTVQDPLRPANLDRYSVHEGDLGDPQPVQVSAGDDIAARLFTVDDLPALGQLEELGDRAVDELAIDGGVVTSVSVRRETDGVVLRFSVESERARGFAAFAADGALVSAERI